MKKDVRKKAFIGAIIGAAASIGGGILNGIKQRKAIKAQQKQQTENEGFQQAQSLSQQYNNQDYIDDYKKKITLRNGGKIKTTKGNDRILVNKKLKCGGRRKAELGQEIGNASGGIGGLVGSLMGTPKQMQQSYGFDYDAKTEVANNSYDNNYEDRLQQAKLGLKKYIKRIK